MHDYNRTVVPIVPKTESHKYGGHSYTLTYDPSAHEDERWIWCVKFIRTYEYFGSAKSLNNANRAARKQIRDLCSRMERGII